MLVDKFRRVLDESAVGLAYADGAGETNVILDEVNAKGSERCNPLGAMVEARDMHEPSRDGGSDGTGESTSVKAEEVAVIGLRATDVIIVGRSLCYERKGKASMKEKDGSRQTPVVYPPSKDDHQLVYFVTSPAGAIEMSWGMYVEVLPVERR